MSGDASVEFAWGDGEYRFRLALGQLRELQTKTSAPRTAAGGQPVGPRSLLRALMTGEELVDDAREILRLGLIGGGMRPPEALALVQLYVDARPLVESLLPARIVLMAAVTGVEDDPVGKPDPEAAPTQGTTDPSPSPASTATAPFSDGVPETSTILASGNSPPLSTVGTEPRAATSLLLN